MVRGLWDCWEDDAFVRDKAFGVFFDPDKMHVLDHKGEHFGARADQHPRTPQGYPVIVQAGASEQGQDMAAATADVVFAAPCVDRERAEYTPRSKAARRNSAARRASCTSCRASWRSSDRTEQEAQDKYGALQALIDPKVGLAQLAASLGDLSGCAISRRPGAGGTGSIRRIRSRAALIARYGEAQQFHHPPALSRGKSRQRLPRRDRLITKDKVGGDGSAADRWWVVGGGLKPLDSPTMDNDPWAVQVRKKLADGGLDYKKSPSRSLVTNTSGAWSRRSSHRSSTVA